MARNCILYPSLIISRTHLSSVTICQAIGFLEILPAGGKDASLFMDAMSKPVDATICMAKGI